MSSVLESEKDVNIVQSLEKAFLKYWTKSSGNQKKMEILDKAWRTYKASERLIKLIN